ncbi:nucleotidyltransferase domain-containing protein [Devosia sp.]|uniref:nucleotidyltransferase domain-containing protein n=1 Tax=Devosia sp. TaxID=1871048 RepID=UPI001AC84656|nr:nucleotidyltransferase domain-containing protein [Devosia sp.]MBN9335437.1 nucleotidyltransferase domain-containing protein [Devosia sp.]
MNQQDIVAAVNAAFADNEAVRGLFLSGSFGRGTADEWSDVDLLAIVAKDDQRGVADQFRIALNELAPVVYWNELDRGGFLINAVTEDWLRCDLNMVEPAAFGQKARNAIIPLIDRDGIFDSLPDALPPRSPSPQALRYQINEFIRVLGLTPVAMGCCEACLPTSSCSMSPCPTPGAYCTSQSFCPHGKSNSCATSLFPMQRETL